MEVRSRLAAGVHLDRYLRGVSAARHLQYTLTHGIGFWWGALVMSILFGAIDGSNQGESPIGLFSAGAVGLVFCISLWYTGSLWWAIGFHAAWDWAQTYFYGTSDSGMVAQDTSSASIPPAPCCGAAAPPARRAAYTSYRCSSSWHLPCGCGGVASPWPGLTTRTPNQRCVVSVLWPMHDRPSPQHDAVRPTAASCEPPCFPRERP